MRRVALLALAVVALLPAGVARADTLVGIGDQDSASFADPLFTPLSVGVTRLVVPWDAIYTQPDRLDAWLGGAAWAGLEPLIAFGHSAADACPQAPCTLPSVAEYRAAFVDFRARFPWVTNFTPWNEPNHGSQPTAGHPIAAADYYNALVDACPECTVTAGDVLDAPGFIDWIRLYRAGLATEPAVWALHNYYDTTYFQMTGVETLMAEVPGQIWLTETGGIVTWRTSDGREALPYNEDRAASSVSYMFDIARAHADRVSRVYIYQWRAGGADDFDAGLERADGSPRPALDVVRAEIEPAPGLLPPGATQPEDGSEPGRAAAVVGPKPFTDAAGVPLHSARILRGGVRVSRGGRLRVPVLCERAPCRGALALEGRKWAAGRYVNGRAQRGTLASRRRNFEMKVPGKVTIAFPIRGALLARARRRGSLPAGLALVPREPLEGWAEYLRMQIRFAR